MKDRLTAAHSSLKAGGVAQITLYQVCRNSLNIPQITRRAHKQPQLCALLCQNSSHMAAYKACGARDESQHYAQPLAMRQSVNGL